MDDTDISQNAKPCAEQTVFRSSFSYGKWAILGIVAILFLSGGGYFYNCTTRNPLFLYKSEVDPDLYPYRYFFKDRLEFCWNFLSQPRSPKRGDKSIMIPVLGSQSQFQIDPGQIHPSYNSQPPTSGWNYPLSGKYEVWKVPRHKTFQKSLEPEVAVRRLYAGFIWITYRSNYISEKHLDIWRAKGDSTEKIAQRVKTTQEATKTPDEIVEVIKKISESTPLVFVTGRSIQDTDITLTALGRQDKFNLENGELTQEHIDRIWDFILRYRNHPQPSQPKPADVTTAPMENNEPE
ncbi:MAG: hypothetical protein HYT98_04280 [Candidatus Sungbacteria bacterium]|nr:hypothetical protein [Candidatus Sungbacteria bacterium]